MLDFALGQECPNPAPEAECNPWLDVWVPLLQGPTLLDEVSSVELKLMLQQITRLNIKGFPTD